MTILFALLPALSGVEGVAQEDLRVLDPQSEPKTMFERWLIAECGKHFEARRRDVAALKTPDDLRRRQAALRAKFIEALGGFPEKTPLNAKVVGRDARDGYRVERVTYESRPGHHVTALLYLPEGAGPFPASIMPMGHSQNGKAADYAQRGSILLAKHGIACLNYDPVGQGERLQVLKPDGKSAFRGSTDEHTQIGTGALLVGWSAATFRIWDAIRSLDYLASRPEIDPSRLGSTGCSGGGTLTSYVMALDERVLAAAPSCYVTSLERLFATIGPQDAEQNIPGQVAFGLEHADYVTMRAPRPTLLLTGTRDFFDIQGSWTTFREAKVAYGLLGRAEAVDLQEWDMPHGYPKEHRQAAVRWMRRWLLGRDEAVVEGDFPIAKDADTWCTPTGQVMSSLKGTSAFDLIAARAADLASARPKLNEDRVTEVLRLRLPKTHAEPIQGPKLKRDGYYIMKVQYKIEPGLTLPALLFVPGDTEPRPSVLYLHGEGKEKDAGPGGPIEALVKDGQVVLSLDLRGSGELKGSPFKEAFLSQHLDRPLLGQRVGDLLAILRAYDGASQIVGVGEAAPAALHAALYERKISKLTLEGGLTSWADVARTPLSKNQLSNVVPGALKVYDLPDLVAAVGARSVIIRHATDAEGKPLTQAEMEEAYAGKKRDGVVLVGR
ncbi:MAG TPA: acetylxylan esterase [Planctomycetota bacterium]